MATRSASDELEQRVVAQGRAMVRLIEAIDVLLENSGSWRETALLKTAQRLYRHRLRELVAVLPPDVSAEILAASEAAVGLPVHNPSLN